MTAPVSGWIPVPVDGWEEVAALLTSTGQPWPESMAVADLRWHVDQAARRLGIAAKRREDVTDEDRARLRAAVPGRPTCCARWHWPERAAKRLRGQDGRPGSWWDSSRWGDQATPGASSERPASVQPASSERPADERSDAEDQAEVSSERPASVQPASSERPSRDPMYTSTPTSTSTHEHVPPAAEPPGAPAPDPTPSEPVAEPDPLAERVRAAALLWGLQALPAQGRKPSDGPQRGKLLDKLRTSCRQDYEATLDAIRFAAESQHSRAVYVREQRYDLDTVLRHRDAYAALWREFGARPEARAPPAAPRPPTRGRSTLGDGVLDRLFAENQAKRGTDGYEA